MLISEAYEEIKRLGEVVKNQNAELAVLMLAHENDTAELEQLRAALTEFGHTPTGVKYRMAVDILSADFEQALAILRIERDALLSFARLAYPELGGELQGMAPRAVVEGQPA